MEDSSKRFFDHMSMTNQTEQVQGIALTSAAISLKRIADAMTSGAKNDRIPASDVAAALGYKPGSAAHDILIRTIETMSAKGFMVVES
jgi:hypothetical protein